MKNTDTTGALRPGRLAKKERKGMKRLLSIAVFTVVMTGWLTANAGKPTPEAQYSQIRGSFMVHSGWTIPETYISVSVNVHLHQDGSASGTITVDGVKQDAVAWGLDGYLIYVGGYSFSIWGGGPGAAWGPGHIEFGHYTVK